MYPHTAPGAQCAARTAFRLRFLRAASPTNSHKNTQILSNNKHAQRRDDSLNQERTEAPNGSGDTQGNHPDVVVEKIDVSWHILIMRARQVIMLE
jgi:hypothetical protein